MLPYVLPVALLEYSNQQPPVVSAIPAHLIEFARFGFPVLQVPRALGSLGICLWPRRSLFLLECAGLAFSRVLGTEESDSYLRWQRQYVQALCGCGLHFFIGVGLKECYERFLSLCPKVPQCPSRIKLKGRVVE